MYSLFVRKNIVTTVTTLFLSLFCVAGAHAANPAYAEAMRGEQRGPAGRYQQNEFEHRGHYAQPNRYNETINPYQERRTEVQGEWQPKEYNVGQPAAPVIVTPEDDNSSSYN